MDQEAQETLTGLSEQQKRAKTDKEVAFAKAHHAEFTCAMCTIKDMIHSRGICLIWGTDLISRAYNYDVTVYYL
jgi:hypothetical protein